MLLKAFETGLSDHHKLISAMMKSGSFKGFPQRKRKKALKEKIKHLENDQYSAFNSVFTNLLNEHAPLKTKTLRYNNKTFITKEILKKS